MKTLYLIIIGLLLNSISSYSQKEAYNWDYGGPNVITFDTPNGEPYILYESILKHNPYSINSQEGVSSISDSIGNFLFSTNGSSIYSYIIKPDSMLYKSGNNEPVYVQLNGYFSSTQGTLIVKKPMSNSLYYVITSSYRYYGIPNMIEGYYYSVIDINGNNGKGHIIEINRLLHFGDTHKLTGITHENGTDVWIISPISGENKIVCYLLTVNGIEKSVVNHIEKSLSGMFYYGYMKPNFKGDYIASAEKRNLFLFSFDKSNGKISTDLVINLDTLFNKNDIYSLLYGVEFSPDGSKIYLTYGRNSIFQIDISKKNIDSIYKSIRKINTDDRQRFNYRSLQLSPNGKIYVALSVIGDDNSQKLAVINKPNLSGDSCEFSINGTSFASSGNHSGLPNFVAGLFDFDVKIAVISACLGDDLVLTAQATPDISVNKYMWTLPDGSEKTGKTITIPNANKSHEGLYKVMVDINSTLRYDSVIVEFHPLPIAKISGNLSFCKNSSTALSAYQSSAYKYKWSTGESTHSIIVKQEGEYHLTVENEFGCKSYDTVFVKYSDDLTFNFVGGDKLCSGDTLVLRTDLVGDDYIYEWSNGESTPEIFITQGGKYTLKVRTEAGCEGIDSITIEEFEKPEVAFQKSFYKLCEGESLTIKPLEINTAYSYLWSDGIAKPERTFTDNAELYLIATSEFGCSDTAFLKIEFLEMPTATIIADKTEACYGEKISLKADNYNPDFSYLWSNGQTAESITVSESGVYKLIMTNENLCSDTSEIEIKIHPDLALELLADKTKLCYDDSTSIYSSSSYSNYLWSTGETIPTITTKEAGIYQLIANNEFGCADTAEIEIFKYDAVLELDSEKLIFGEICVGESQERRINLKLVSGNEFRISRIATTSNNFEIRSSKEIIKLGESAQIIVIFKPQEAGIYDDEIVIESTVPCVFSKSLPISASSKQIIEFSIENHYAEAGQYLEIPLYAEIKCPEPLNESLDYEITVEFDKEYFAPDSLKFGEIISSQIIDNKRIIVIKANGNFNQNKSVVNVIYGNAFLGRTEVTDILIDDTKFFKTRYFPEYINGSLSVDGCVNDITTIQMFNPTKMTVSPNPTDGELKVSIGTQEQGSFSLVIFNVQGKEVFRSEFTKNDKTYLQKEININTQNMSNGIYTIHLTAPWTLLREKVGIVR